MLAPGPFAFTHFRFRSVTTPVPPGKEQIAPLLPCRSAYSDVTMLWRQSKPTLESKGEKSVSVSNGTAAGCLPAPSAHRGAARARRVWFLGPILRFPRAGSVFGLGGETRLGL